MERTLPVETTPICQAVDELEADREVAVEELVIEEVAVELLVMPKPMRRADMLTTPEVKVKSDTAGARRAKHHFTGHLQAAIVVTWKNSPEHRYLVKRIYAIEKSQKCRWKRRLMI